VFCTSLGCQLAALPPLKLVLVRGEAAGSTRVEYTIDRVVYIAWDRCRRPYRARSGVVLRPERLKAGVASLEPVGLPSPRLIAVVLVHGIEYCSSVVCGRIVQLIVVVISLLLSCAQVNCNVILRRLIMLVVVNRLVRVDALLVVGKEVFEY
jgi:hypothetical protein